MSTKQFDYGSVADAYKRIGGVIHRTPVFTSASIDGMLGCNVFFKAECLQKTGSFKARGASNAILKLKSEQNVSNVITHSSGNFGQALAFAARNAGVMCTVVVPENAPRVKVEAIRGYGANIVQCPSTMIGRVSTCDRVASETGAVFVHPYDNFDVMAGQGTMALELLEDVEDLDAILVPVGGGGMIAGVATWTKHIKPDCKVFAVEPSGKCLSRSLNCGRVICEDPSKPLDTIADGMRIPDVGKRCFPVLLELCEKEVFSVTDEQIISTMKLIYQRLKLAVEPSAATTTAALFGESFRKYQPSLKRVGVIISGGNVDLDKLPWTSK